MDRDTLKCHRTSFYKNGGTETDRATDRKMDRKTPEYQRMSFHKNGGTDMKGQTDGRADGKTDAMVPKDVIPLKWRDRDRVADRQMDNKTQEYQKMSFYRNGEQKDRVKDSQTYPRVQKNDITHYGSG